MGHWHFGRSLANGNSFERDNERIISTESRLLYPPAIQNRL